MVLDFNNTDNFLIDGFQAWALENLVVPRAKSYGLGPQYEYLRPSIKAFPTGKFPCFMRLLEVITNAS